MLRLLALNSLSSTDIWFFVLCGVAVAVIVGVYFLIPVFNKKQYQEQRDNLRKREVAFKANLKIEEHPAVAEDVQADVVEQEQTTSENTEQE